MKDTKLLSAAMAGLLLTAGCSMMGPKLAANEVKCNGVNSCKGQGLCGGKNNSCKGMNSCKGQGWLKLSQDDCKAKGGTF